MALVESLSAAIDHAASRGVHHGSLHLRDIILSPDGARMTGFGIAAALAQVSAKLPTRPPYSSPGGRPSDLYSLGAIALEAVTGKRASADGLREFEAAYAPQLRGAFGAALAAFGGATNSLPAQEFPPERMAPPNPEQHDFDLRIRQPVDLMSEPDDIAVDPVIESPQAVEPAWSPQPSRLFQADDDPPETRSRRWPIVLMFLAFGIVAALAAGYFLKAPTPVLSRDPAAGVAETTVDLPVTPAPAPAPAPAPSRPASGAVDAPPKPPRGSLLIRSTPTDADVLVNGQARGKTPLTVRDLALGSYTIRVVREGYVAEERKLQLTAQQPTTSTTIVLRSTSARGATVDKPSTPRGAAERGASSGTAGALSVQSRPPGARVFVNDQLLGSTPLVVPGFPEGPAQVRIEMDGYQTWATTVRVAAGEQTRVAASLESK